MPTSATEPGADRGRATRRNPAQGSDAGHVQLRWHAAAAKVSCPSCGQEHQGVTGFVLRGGSAYAIYFADWYPHASEARLDVVLGTSTNPRQRIMSPSAAGSDTCPARTNPHAHWSERPDGDPSHRCSVPGCPPGKPAAIHASASSGQ
jgi:hypothetical protein